jgi:molecular chaperone GrpE
VDRCSKSEQAGFGNRLIFVIRRNERVNGKEMPHEIGEHEIKEEEVELLEQKHEGAEAEQAVRGDGGEAAVPTATEGSQAVGQAAVSGPSIEELSTALEQIQQKADGYWNDLLRARAEIDNVRKRTEREVANAHKYGQERLILELLPVKDSLELGLAASDQPTSIEGLREGIELTLKMFSTVLEKTGVAVIEPQGERFNPELHQAMTVQGSSEVEPGTVLMVVQKGYLLHDRVLRPAMVVVAKEPSDA